jgi:glycosyltransferase involved in cell wall biosynthesis
MRSVEHTRHVPDRTFDTNHTDLPLVSVITPTYNQAGYLGETIQSILSQDYPRVEYIVLDDGSTDDTRNVLQKYGSRIIWETHPNMGEHRTVNKGWMMSHGEIIAVINSDDLLLPGAISSAVKFMTQRPEILVAYPDWNLIDTNSSVIRHVQVLEYDYLFMVRHHECLTPAWAFMRRDALLLANSRDPSFKYVADFDYWLRLGLHGTFARIPETLAAFRVHHGSISVAEQGRAMAKEHILLVRKFYSIPSLPLEIREVRREAFANAHRVAADAAGRALWVARWHRLMAELYDWRNTRRSYRAVIVRSHRWTLLKSFNTARAIVRLFPVPLQQKAVNAWLRPLAQRVERFAARCVEFVAGGR